MLNRRIAIAGFAALAFNVTAAHAQDWKAKYPELVFAIVPAENASGVNDRYDAVRRTTCRRSSAPR